MMASLFGRAFTATSVKWGSHLRGRASFVRQLACSSGSNIVETSSYHRLSAFQQATLLHPFIPKHPALQQQYHSSWVTKYQLSRALSSDAAVLEDDTNVFYDGLVKRIESQDIQLIDVREAFELAEFGQIANSIHIPLGELEASLRLSEDKFELKYNRPMPKETDGDIVFHCRSGVRSLNAVNIAKEQGYSKARHFPGGWMQWAEKNNLPSA